MTGYRLATLTCDECGEIFDSGINFTIPDARKAARNRGWTCPARGEDLCRQCSTRSAEQEREA